MDGSKEGWSLQEYIELFRRQFLQLEDPDRLSLPPDIVRRPELQRYLYETMFRDGCLAYAPPDRYKLRVLKKVIQHLEQAVADPEQDEISDDLTACLAELLSQPQVPDSAAAQQRTYVTYTSPVSLSVLDGIGEPRDGSLLPVLEPCTVTLLESRALLASSGTTGLRTWEAALRLGQYLVSEQGISLVQGRNVLELGAGTGFVSVLCAKHLRADHVLATDGSGDVVNSLAENIYLNGLEQTKTIRTAVLKWGHGLIDDILNGNEEERAYDVILGADVTYDHRSLVPLVTTLSQLFERNANTKALISATIRNETTIEKFIAACRRRQMAVENISEGPFLEESQLGFFHPTATEIRLFSITAC